MNSVAVIQTVTEVDIKMEQEGFILVLENLGHFAHTLWIHPDSKAGTDYTTKGLSKIFLGGKGLKSRQTAFGNSSVMKLRSKNQSADSEQEKQNRTC